MVEELIFCDIEISTITKKPYGFGFVYGDQEKLFVFDDQSISYDHVLDEATKFIKTCESKIIVGHNFIDFDKEHTKNTIFGEAIKEHTIIDTLWLSLLFLNHKTSHKLPKNYKTECEMDNNPVEDSKNTKKLFIELSEKFDSIDKTLKTTFYSLLKEHRYFEGFFKYLNQNLKELKDEKLVLGIIKTLKDFKIDKKYLAKTIQRHPLELANIISLLTPHTDIKAHPPYILNNCPEILNIQKKMYEQKGTLENHAETIFGFKEFNKFERPYDNILDSSLISQENIIQASINDESFLCVLPTGGGKTFCFWLPAIIKASLYKTLTVVISPLQALIKDHIQNFEEQVANYKAVAISGFMNPSQRAEAIDDTINGKADILYIAPESLRSDAIFNMLKNRAVERFVIDEAHCLSTWGNDFRQDYFYICDYIKELQDKKPGKANIPVSCFTATAKPSVIQDIKDYFESGLKLKLEEYLASPDRKNLTYSSIESNKEEKYEKLKEIINTEKGSALIYIPTSTKDCDEIAQKLKKDTKKTVKSFHSKIESEEKMKILKDYIDDKIDIIVATTAFGMGVDKPNIENVIHYEMSDSLESYAQEAGRGARGKDKKANCPILFDESDMDKHFDMLKRSKLTIKEIDSVWRVLKNYKTDTIIKTAFEIARDARWDIDTKSSIYTTKIKTALLELERAGFIKRKRNKIKFYANSLDSKATIKLKRYFTEQDIKIDEKERLNLVLNTIIEHGLDKSTLTDELSHVLGYDKSTISNDIEKLKTIGILGDEKDLSLKYSLSSLEAFTKYKEHETAIFEHIKDKKQVCIRELITKINTDDDNTIPNTQIKMLIKSWIGKDNFSFYRKNRVRDIWSIDFKDKTKTKTKNNITTKHDIAIGIVDYLKLKSCKVAKEKQKIEFSLIELQDKLEPQHTLKEIDSTLLYLHNLEAIELLSGRFISYMPMTIHKIEGKSNQRYTNEEYKKRLGPYYETKIHSIHIAGEFAKRLIGKSLKNINFLKDYFSLGYEKFIKKYKLLKNDISMPITQKRFDEIYKVMSHDQQKIIDDNTTKAMMIIAGPGSGKTKVLVHKIASILFIEQTKPEAFLMLTFSRTAKLEFKSKLNKLIGSNSHDIEIQTFHAYALKLLSKNYEEKENDSIIKEATKQIIEKKILVPFISILVLDEYQDINEDSFEFIKALYEANNKDMKVIAVGDDDQCIYDFTGANVEYFDKFKEYFLDTKKPNSYKKYELSINYRSCKEIVNYTNDFRENIKNKKKNEALTSGSKHKGNVQIRNYPNATTLSVPVVELAKKHCELNSNEKLVILTYTNKSVMQIYSLLIQHNINAKFIIDRDKFQTKNIIELFIFDDMLKNYLKDDDKNYKIEHFEKTLEKTKKKFENSTNIKLLEKIVKKFMNENDELLVSDWLSYVDEIKLEDFEYNDSSVAVSTIHRSKGMEFDNVFLIADKLNKDDTKNGDNMWRVYYVGMTRAIKTLTIFHTNKTRNREPYAQYHTDETKYIEDNKIFTYIMGLRDIVLNNDYCEIDNYYAGQKVKIEQSIHPHYNSIYYAIVLECGTIIGALSSQSHGILNKQKDAGFEFNKASIEHVVIRYHEKSSKYIKYPLCKIVMNKA